MFIMLCGAPGSGKSTWAEGFIAESEKFNKEVCLVSSDGIRKELYGDESIQRDHAKVFQIAHKRIVNALKRDCDFVVFDATNMTRKNRNSIMAQIRHISCEKRCYIFAEPYEVLCRRNKMRSRNVPDVVIWNMLKKFEVPLFSEGFDSIELINRNQICMDEFIEYMRGFNQNNSHHSLDLYSHCEAAALYLYERQPDKSRIRWTTTAAFLHDIGKLFTKEFKNYKGEVTEDAHYYGHANIGGYLALLFDMSCDWIERLAIAQMICYHMVPYDKNESAQKRWRERLGTLYPSIMLIHEADKAAH